MLRAGRRRLIAAAAVVVAATSLAARAASEGSRHDVLISRQLAARAGLHVGDAVTLAADASGTRAATFRVAGVYEPTPDPLRFSLPRLETRLHLPDGKALLTDPLDGDADSVDAINIRLADPTDAAEIAETLTARVPGIVARPTARARDGSDPFAVLERFHRAVAIVTVLGSTAFLLALMVMRAEERAESVGIARLIGISGRSILLSVLVEGLIIAVAGAAFGILLAVATQGAVNRYFQWRYDTALVFVRVTWAIALRAIALSAPLGIAAGLVGSWSLLRRTIVSLVRR